MAIDTIGATGGWGTCDDCTGLIRQVEITKGLLAWMVLKHGPTCPQIREACS